MRFFSLLQFCDSSTHLRICTDIAVSATTSLGASVSSLFGQPFQAQTSAAVSGLFASSSQLFASPVTSIAASATKPADLIARINSGLSLGSEFGLAVAVKPTQEPQAQPSPLETDHLFVPASQRQTMGQPATFVSSASKLATSGPSPLSPAPHLLSTRGGGQINGADCWTQSSADRFERTGRL